MGDFVSFVVQENQHFKTLRAHALSIRERANATCPSAEHKTCKLGPAYHTGLLTAFLLATGECKRRATSSGRAEGPRMERL
eukprot:6307630-Amphidinium_carterae.1